MIFLARYSWILFVFENADDDPWQIKLWWTLYRATAESGSSVTRGMVCWRVLGKGVCVTALIKCRYYSAFEFIWEIVCVKLCLWVIPVSYVWLSVCSAHHTGISTRLIISSRRPTGFPPEVQGGQELLLTFIYFCFHYVWQMFMLKTYLDFFCK